MLAAQRAAAETQAPADEPPAEDIAPHQETLERVIAERRATTAARSKGDASYRPPEDVQARLQALLAGRPPLPRPPPPS
jgi:hypothetical protein